MAYIHITEAERRRIERLHTNGTSIRGIARKLGRSPSAIKYEIDRNKVKGKYVVKKAEHKAVQRRKKSKLQCMKVSTSKELKAYVKKHIKNEQSPQGISERLKNVDKHIGYASAKAIYKFVHSPHGRQIEKHLYSKSVKKKGGPKRGKLTIWSDGRVSIERRPKHILKRKEFGHFEGDFIESGKDGEGSLLVLVERKTRYPFLAYCSDRSTKAVNALVEGILHGVPVLSVTLDNDVSFKKHKELSELLCADIFFCHPYSSWEKGSVENRNKAVRRYIPKRSDISQYQEEYIREVERKLRGKFMVCLKGKSPQEAWDDEVARHHAKLTKTKKTATKGRKINSKSVLLEGYM